MTDFRAISTIMGPAGLTAVFGMGTGVAPPVSSPGKRAPGRSGPGAAGGPRGRWEEVGPLGPGLGWRVCGRGTCGAVRPAWPRGARRRVGVVKPLGCWDRSAAAVARRARPAHRPGRLPGAFTALADGGLVSERASRLDAFSAYPFPT